MHDKLLHDRKRHLIEHVTDDVRSMRQDDVALQKTLLTGRAIKDLLSGDTISNTNASDAKYFGGGAKVDFDLIDDPSIRYVDANSYVNGPLAGTANQKDCGALIHTLTVLPDGKLSYEDGTREGSAESIRQVFYPNDPTDMDAYTRIGTWDPSSESYVWSGWISLSGRSLRILVKGGSDIEESILANILPYTIYELHCGGHSITLPNADSLMLATCVSFEQYANTNYTFTKVTESAPVSGTRYYTKQADGTGSIFVRAGNNGFLSAFVPGVEYYTRDRLTQFVNIVNYTEKIKDYTGQIKETTYSTTLLPGIDTTRADATDGPIAAESAYYEDSHEAVLYRFEVVDREEPFIESPGKTTSRTWMLDVQPEAIDALEGFAELLGAHTDMKVDDIVKYDRRGFTGSASYEGFNNAQIASFTVPNIGGNLVVTHPTNMRGVAKITLSVNSARADEISAGFLMSVYKYNEYDGNFDASQVSLEYIPETTAGLTPNPYKKYYTYSEITGYILAGNGGVLDRFENGVQYYTRALTPSANLNVARCRVNGEYRAAKFGGTVSNSVDTVPSGNHRPVTLSEFTSKPLEAFIDVARNDILMVVIHSDNHDIDKTIVSPVVEIYPDPHDSYIPTVNINKDAFTNRDLDTQSLPCVPEQSVPSSRALTAAYEMIVNALQGKGLAYGRLKATSTLDGYVNPGVYTIAGNLVSSVYHTSSGASSDGTMFDNGTLIVMSTARTADPSVTVLKDTDVTATSNAVVTQIVFGYRKSGSQNIPIAEIWWRIKPATTWSAWARIGTTPSISTTFTNTEVAASSIEQLLSAGNAVVVVNPGNSSSVVTVNLPDPKYHRGAKMQVEAVNCPIKITYGTYEYSCSTVKDRMLYPLECDGEYWYVITVS